MQECPSCHKLTLSFCLRSGSWVCLSERPKCGYSETDAARRYRLLGFVGIRDVASCHSRTRRYGVSARTPGGP